MSRIKIPLGTDCNISYVYSNKGPVSDETKKSLLPLANIIALFTTDYQQTFVSENNNQPYVLK